MALVKKGQPKTTPCLICGQPATQSICHRCEVRIQGEAIEKKQEVEKKGRTEQGRK